MPHFNTPEELFNYIEELRELCALSISELCRELGISESSYYRWKRGNPPAQVISLLSILKFIQGDDSNGDN